MASASLNTNLSGKLEQLQQLSGSQLNSLELLALPQIALSARLAQEFAANPVLEEVPPEPSGDIAPGNDSAESVDNDENDYETNSFCAEEWADNLPLPGNERDAALSDYFSNSPAPPPSLKAMLLSELSCSACPEELLPAALEIISALDDDGFLTLPLPDIAMSCDAGMDEVERALAWVQNIAPAGVAARDAAESLKLQLLRRGELTPALEKLLSEGVEELEKNQLPALCSKLGVSPQELTAMLKTLRQLDPAPGREKNKSSAVIVPDIEIIRREDGSLHTEVKRDHLARITVSPLYEKMLDDPGLAADDRKYIAEKISRAQELVQALRMRGSTLERLGDVIIGEQRDFFEYGVSALRPLTMKHAAELLNLSESTISRAVAEKYAATPKGVYPLRFFFTGGFAAGNDGEIAVQAVKSRIREAIEDEDPRTPLSDEAIAAQLRSDGIPVARRTVAKYRESMNIPTSSRRKKHF